jgi:octaprenyl-diphosphate synthase
VTPLSEQIEKPDHQAREARELLDLPLLFSLSQDDMVNVNALIIERLQSEVSIIPALADHLIAAGGKRLRPLLCVVAAQMCQTKSTNHIKLSTAVEFIHTATLLHDDVVDSSQLRRGNVAAHLIWGAPSSVLVGDFLFARAFELMVETGSLRALDILSKASAIITEGEVMQLTRAFDIGLSVYDYLKIIEAKTAALFAAAAQSGAVSANASEDEIMALYNYGLNLGLAFQIRDDVMDYTGHSDHLGKNAGDDFREGKITLPLIEALSGAVSEDRRFWDRIIGGSNQNPDDFQTALNLMHDTGALSSSQAKAESFSQKAIDSLTIFKDSPHKKALTALAHHSVHRQS